MRRIRRTVTFYWPTKTEIVYAVFIIAAVFVSIWIGLAISNLITHPTTDYYQP